MNHGEPLYESVKKELGYDPDMERFLSIVESDYLKDLPEVVPVTYGSDMDLTAVPIPALELTAEDRCDRCGARALARATFGEMELLFCRHHKEEQAPALEEKGWTVSSAPV